MNLIQFTLGSSRCQQDEQLIRIEAVNKIPLKAKTSSDLLVSFMLKPLTMKSAPTRFSLRELFKGVASFFS